MRRLIFFLLVFSLFFAGCTATIEKSSEKITPSSYSSYTGSKGCQIGLLRRLLMLPPQYIYMHNGKRQPEEEKIAKTTLRKATLDFLENFRGYEVVIQEESIQGPTDSATNLLFDWVEKGLIGVQPPTEVQTAVSTLSGQNKADGLLLVRGFQKPPSTWNVAAVCLTASLSWPLLLMEQKGYLSADIIEASSGRIVWRIRSPMLDASKPLSATQIQELLGSLERAVPEALTK